MVSKINSKKDCQMEAEVLFSKLSSLREESYKQFSNIIQCHSISISEGIRDLTDKVCGLQTELAVVRKEKSVLLETVDNLNGEIRQLNAKFQSVTLTMEKLDIVKEELQYEETSENMQSPQQIILTSTNDDPVVADQAIKDEREYMLHKNVTSELSSLDEENVREADKVRDIPTSEQAAGDKIACPECKFEFSTTSNLQIHLRNVHPELDNDVSLASRQSDHQNFQSPRNQFENSKYAGVRKRSSMPEKTESYVCEDCGYTTNRKYELKRHRISVHKIGEARFKCNICSYMTSYSGNFKTHMASVHKTEVAKFKCSICSYKTYIRGNFKRHKDKRHN